MPELNNQPGQIRIGVSPLSWVNEVLQEFGANTTASQVLSEASVAGFQGVELSRAFPSDAAQLGSLLSRHGQQLASGWYSGFLADRSFEEECEAVVNHATLLQTLGASVLVYGECGRMAENALDIPMSGRLRLEQSEWPAYCERLSRFAAHLESRFGLKLVYHYHLMMVAETLEEVRNLMRSTSPDVRLLLDTGHAYAAGFDYNHLIVEFGARIDHVHLKDVRPQVLDYVRRDDLTFNDAVRAGMFTVPGDGVIDFAPLSRFLVDSAYSGWLVVEAEQNPELFPPLATVTRANQFVRQHVLPAPHNS